MNAPVAKPETAIAVIDPKSYAAWDPLLDLFDEIRAETPVLRIESPTDDHAPFWLITRHEDVMRISKDNATFLNSPRPSVLTNRAGEDLARQITGGSPNLVQSLVSLDAPKHPKLRRLTQEWFMPKNLKLIEADIKELAKRTVDRLIAAGPEADFVPLVSAPYPLHVVMQILGVPEEDEPRMLFLTQQMFGGQDEDLNKTGMANLSPEQISQIVLGAVKDFTEYFEKLAEERRQNPGKDVATILANGTIDGQPLDPLDLAGYYIIVAAAGHDTTSASTAGAMLALAKDPEQFAKVKADRSLVAGIVEEAIRWTTPVQHFMRMANEDVEIAGVQIAKGDWLMLNYVAANHDPAQFDEPRKFEAARDQNRHIAFGAGAHQCLGLHLARLEMRILFEEILDRLDSVELAGEPKRANSTFVGGLKTLPIRFRAS
ncbi:cytochrome P450 [Sphingorhabdus pulchriflava]|uniref:Cytochrome P450 n=1 Tax=Sphingorhabdus pulchriflava TaxID=2292257 RepID=A0A371B1Z1_9SPHN|nr:cytochrome P450 [Sphingorhabdus pulchriflava]MBK7162129.1 cytochrome P450 [Sphingomonadales bacterium]RDV01524.1 cytochrome P450 [Sphingorhabdus pulchriflava]